MADSVQTNILPVKHTTYVLHRLNEQRKNGMFCDATLIVEGEKFQVHRSFLAANSDYFLSLFASAEEQVYFVLAGVPLQGFRVILDFIYSSTFVLNMTNVHDVYRASSALNFTHVQSACEKVYRRIKQIERAKAQAARYRKDDEDITMIADEEAPESLIDSPSSSPNSVNGGTPVLDASAKHRISPSHMSIENKFETNPPSNDCNSSSRTSQAELSPSRRTPLSPQSPARHGNDIIPLVKPMDLASVKIHRKVKIEGNNYNHSPTIPSIATSTDPQSPKRMKVEFLKEENELKEERSSLEQEQICNRQIKRTASPIHQAKNAEEDCNNLNELNGLLKRPKKTFVLPSGKEKLLFFDPHHKQTLSEDIRSKWGKNNNFSFGFRKSASEPNHLNHNTNYSSLPDESEQNPVDVRSTPFSCTFRTSVEKATSDSNHKQQSGKSKTSETCDHVFSNWKLITTKEQRISPERQVKVHRNRRKLLKTNKVCTN